MRREVFVDSGAWFALYIAADPNHSAACRWMATSRGALLTTDYVIDETLTLLRARGQREISLDFGTAVFANELANDLAVVHYVTPTEIAAAWEVFHRFADKDWSFTDCTSKVILEGLGLATAFAFDQHFRQFGTVLVVP